MVRNSIYNFLGFALPIAAGFFCIPKLIIQLGDARFGILSLIWVVVSYFNIFDLGLGRSLTIAISSNKNKGNELSSIAKTGTIALAILGFIGGLILAILVFFGVPLIKFLADPVEAKSAALLMATAMPAIVLTSGFRGILEAFHEFKIINLIRVPMSIWTFVCPLLVVNYWENDLILVTGVLVAGRYITCFMYAHFASLLIAKYKIKSKPAITNIKIAKSLFQIGGWMTVSNLISALLAYMDRFLIGTILSASAVAYYSTPQELVSKLLIIPASITLVLFPALSEKVFLTSSKKEVEFLFNKSINMIILATFPIAFSVGIFSEEILHFWISQIFAEHSAFIMQIFIVGVIINSITQVPFTLIQSSGNSKLIAIINMIQLPFFIVILFISTKIYGIEGAAFAWLFRLTADAVMMFYAIRFVSADFNSMKIPNKQLLKIMLIILLFSFSCNLSFMFKLLFAFISILTSLLLCFRVKLKKINF